METTTKRNKTDTGKRRENKTLSKCGSWERGWEGWLQMVRLCLSHTHTHTRARARTHACTRTHAHTHAHTRTHARTLSRTRTHARARTHARTHTHTHTRTHMHTHVHRPNARDSNYRIIFLNWFCMIRWCTLLSFYWCLQPTESSNLRSKCNLLSLMCSCNLSWFVFYTCYGHLSLKAVCQYSLSLSLLFGRQCHKTKQLIFHSMPSNNHAHSVGVFYVLWVCLWDIFWCTYCVKERFDRLIFKNKTKNICEQLSLESRSGIEPF